jgi:hypothetical protein
MDLSGIDPLDIGIVKYEQNTLINIYNYRDMLKQASVMVINIKKTQYNLLIYIRAKYNKITMKITI